MIQQIAAAVILPLALLLAGRLQGLVRLTPSRLLVAAVVLAVVNLLARLPPSALLARLPSSPPATTGVTSLEIRAVPFPAG